jgi:hypothetical protein
VTQALVDGSELKRGDVQAEGKELEDNGFYGRFPYTEMVQIVQSSFLRHVDHAVRRTI